MFCNRRNMSLKFPTAPACIVTVILVLLGTIGASAQMIDLNGNGMSDIWEWVYGATNVNPKADPDGDGFSNAQEATAGTNPFDYNSYPHIPIVLYSPTNFSVTMPCALGKLYQLQSIPTLGSTNWFVETNLEALSGTNVTPVSYTHLDVYKRQDSRRQRRPGYFARQLTNWCKAKPEQHCSRPQKAWPPKHWRKAW